MIVSDDGDTVRLDGVCRGALLINKTGADYRLRMTNTEGGKFVFDCTFPKGAGLHRKLKLAFWIVRSAAEQGCGESWVHNLLRLAFDDQAQAA